MEGIEGIRIWECIFSPPDAVLIITQKKQARRESTAELRKPIFPPPLSDSMQTLLGTEVWVGHKIKSELKGAPCLTSFSLHMQIHIHTEMVCISYLVTDYANIPYICGSASNFSYLL